MLSVIGGQWSEWPNALQWSHCSRYPAGDNHFYLFSSIFAYFLYLYYAGSLLSFLIYFILFCSQNLPNFRLRGFLHSSLLLMLVRITWTLWCHIFSERCVLVKPFRKYILLSVLWGSWLGWPCLKFILGRSLSANFFDQKLSYTAFNVNH